MRSRRAAVWLLALAFLVAGCGGGDDGAEAPPETEPPTETSTPTETDQVEPQLAQECSNAEYGFTIRYPEGWHTNGGEVVPECSFFHPEPFEVPEATEVTEFAVMARREPVAFDRISGPSPAIEIVEREEVEVAGRGAVRREIEATGEGLLPAGTRTTQYLVDLDGETLVLETYDVGGLDYDANRSLLRRMAESLELQPR